MILFVVELVYFNVSSSSENLTYTLPQALDLILSQHHFPAPPGLLRAEDKEMRDTRVGCSARITTKMQWLLLSALTSFESLSHESWHSTSNVALVCMFTWIMQHPNIIIIVISPSSVCLQQPLQTKSFLVVGWRAAKTVDWRCSCRPYSSSCSVVSRTQISQYMQQEKTKDYPPLPWTRQYRDRVPSIAYGLVHPLQIEPPIPFPNRMSCDQQYGFIIDLLHIWITVTLVKQKEMFIVSVTNN